MIPNTYIIYESEEGMLKMAEALEQIQMYHLSNQKYFTDEMVNQFIENWNPMRLPAK